MGASLPIEDQDEDQLRMKPLFTAVLAGLLCTPLGAAELVHLATGFVIEAVRVEFAGNVARLTTRVGELEIPRAQIANIDTMADVSTDISACVRNAAEPVSSTVAVTAMVTPAAAVVSEPVAVVGTPKTAEQFLVEAANRYGLPPALVRSVARAESGIRQDAISPKGAIGVMQLMPETAGRLGADPMNLEQNIDAGARYLRDLLVRYDGSTHKALAAYNAGEQAVDRYQGIPPYEETQIYVRRVLGHYLKSLP
jgi:soluble lytic murein transglycosylase-like protein